jgi:hypothetical protein
LLHNWESLQLEAESMEKVERQTFGRKLSVQTVTWLESQSKFASTAAVTNMTPELTSLRLPAFASGQRRKTLSLHVERGVHECKVRLSAARI